MTSAEGSVLVFELGGRRFGLAAERVDEVVRAVTVAPLPGAPSMVEGVIDVRGSLVPVFDVRARLGLPPRGADHPEHLDHLVIASAGPRSVAVRVDRALALLPSSPRGYTPLRPAVEGAPLVAGVARSEEGLVVVCDLEAFLSSEEGASLDRALDEARDEGALTPR